MSIPLRQVVRSLSIDRDIATSTLEQYERSVRYFSNFIGRDAEPGDLNESRVNLWTTDLQAKYDPVTVKNYLRGLLCVWNYATSLGLVAQYQSAKLRKPKCPPKIVDAWRPETVAKLEDYAGKLPGVLVGGCAVSTYMLAYTMTAADTMLRPSDMRLVEWRQMSDGKITLNQHKTGFVVIRPLRAKTLESLDNLKKFKRVERIFWLGKGGQRYHEDNLRKLAGVWESGKSLGKLRHAGATQIAMRHGINQASLALGHVPGSNVAPRFYVNTTSVGVGPWG